MIGHLPRRTIIIAVAIALLIASVGMVGLVLRRGRLGSEPSIERWASEVAQDPADVGARLQLGYAYQSNGDYDRALAQYERVLELEPRNTAALFDRATLYLATGRQKQAETGFWDVLEIEPDHVGASIRLGRLYASKGEYRSVLEAVRPVVGVHPESADLQYLTGLAYENLGRPDWALARYKLALKASPDMPEASSGIERLGAAR